MKLKINGFINQVTIILIIVIISVFFTTSCDKSPQVKSDSNEGVSANRGSKDEIEIKNVVEDFINTFSQATSKNAPDKFKEVQPKFEAKTPNQNNVSPLESAALMITVLFKNFNRDFEMESFEGDKASVLVKFSQKQSSSSFAYMRFNMLKQDNQWKISDIKRFENNEIPKK